MLKQDTHWLKQTINLAQHAETLGEVPVGAVLVIENEVVGVGWNQPISTHDPCAHAEIVALRAAAQQIKNYRLLESTLYVSLEPCLMCMGAILHARVKRLVFAAFDPRAGAAGSLFNLAQTTGLNHKVEVTGGLLAEESGDLLRAFFRKRR